MKVDLTYELIAFGKKHMNSLDETMFMRDVTLTLDEGSMVSLGQLLDMSIRESKLEESINLNTIDSLTLSRVIYE